MGNVITKKYASSSFEYIFEPFWW